MRTRILPPEEWHRLEQPGLPQCFPYPNARDAAFVVVEDEHGCIVACLGIVRITHLEGTWVAPEYRGNAGVMRALLRQATELPRAAGDTWVMGGAERGDAAMRGYLERLGATFVPVDYFVLPIGKE